MKQIIRYAQNSPEWEAWRKHTFGASDCAAMLGVSPYKTRAQLLREKQGEPQKTSAFQAEIFAQGHAAEKAIMPYLQERLGRPVAPCVMEIAGKFLKFFTLLTKSTWCVMGDPSQETLM